MVLSKTFNRTAFALLLAMAASIPSVASPDYVYLKCNGKRTHLYYYPQTGEDESEYFAHEIHVALDEVNSRIRIGQRDVKAVWQDAAFTAGEVVVDEEDSGKLFDVDTRRWSFDRNTGRYQGKTVMKNAKFHATIIVIGDCKRQEPARF